MSKSGTFKLISIILVLAFVLGACAPAATQAPAAATKAPASADKVSPAGEFPISKETITLKAFINPRANINYEKNEFTKLIEKKLNIKLIFDVPPVADFKQKLNLVLASDDLPDVFIGGGIALDQQQILAQQGTIIPLNDLIDKYGKEFKTVLQTAPATKDLITLLDGKIYALPDYNECYHCSMSQKMWIYKPWLDKLGLKIPETTDEFYAMLKAFKEKDPNGNGKADEIALSGSLQGANSGWQAQIDSYIMNSFVYNDRITPNGARHLILDGGIVKAAFVQDGWKEGLKYLNKLYSEGLIDPQSFTNDSNKIKQLGENPDVPILGAMSAGWYGVFTQNGGPSGRWKDYVAIPPLKGPSGMRATPKAIYQPYGQGWFLISKKCKNPEAAFRLADWFYSFEATTDSVFGVEGEDWVRAKDNEVSISGGKALYNVLKVWGGGEENTRHWSQTAPTFRTGTYRLGQTFNPADPLERTLYEATKNNMEPYGVADKAVPPVVFTADQSKQFGELNTTVFNAMDEWFANFITGKKSVDKDWDAYLKTLKDSGLDQFLKLYQDAINAKGKK